MQVIRWLLLSVLLAIPHAASADCDQICYPGLPCQGTEIGNEQRIAGDLCAGDLVLLDGARLILEGEGAHLINVERSLKVVGSAEIVTASCLVKVSSPTKANSPAIATVCVPRDQPSDQLNDPP